MILCYAFPPHEGIGGRRWYKFAEQLIEKNYQVSVISAMSKNQNVQKLKLFNHYKLSLIYPKALIYHRKSLLHKLLYKISLFKVKRQTKGNYYDRTINWLNQVIDAFNSINTNKNITHCIISGAPFHWLTFINDLKKINQNCKFIADIRDPWTINKSAYGFASLDERRFLLEKEKEKKLCLTADTIICVNESIANYFKSLNEDCKIVVIENGFDENELLISKQCKIKIDDSYLNLVFTGSIYDNTGHLFKILFEELLTNYEKYSEVIRFHFYGSTNEKLIRILPNKLKNMFIFGKLEKSEDVNYVISKSNYCLLFLSDDINDSLSTKFCEYIKFRKKIILFSKEGFTSDYILKNKIGLHVNENNISELFKNLIEIKDLQVFPNNYDIAQFSIKTLTKKLEKVLNL